MSSRKVNDLEVRAIRHYYAAGGWKQVELAEKFGISQPRVSSIVRKRARTGAIRPIVKEKFLRQMSVGRVTSFPSRRQRREPPATSTAKPPDLP